MNSNKLVFSLDVKFYKNVFPFKLKSIVFNENERLFLKTFPFFDIDSAIIYDDMVLDEVDDPSISIEKGLITSLEGRNFEAIENGGVCCH